MTAALWSELVAEPCEANRDGHELTPVELEYADRLLALSRSIPYEPRKEAER